MWDEMRTLGREISDDPTIRALVVIGNGRAFSSGIDTSVFTGGTPDDVLAQRRPDTHDDPTVAGILRAQQSYSWLENARYPTIAAVRGYALGAGLQLALACDIRVFARGTEAGLLEHKYGILPDLGGTQRLPRVVGAGKAKEMIWTAARIDADEAYRIGLCERFVDDAELEKAVGVARERDRGAATARGAGREACGRRCRFLPVAEGLVVEAEAQSIALRSNDMREAITAFVEKRPPALPGIMTTFRVRPTARCTARSRSRARRRTRVPNRWPRRCSRRASRPCATCPPCATSK